MCDECATKVLDILDKMEQGGEFDGLTPEQKEQERTLMGNRLRFDMVCPAEERFYTRVD